MLRPAATILQCTRHEANTGLPGELGAILTVNVNTVLELRGITKIFAGRFVLNGIDLQIAEGTLHALIGESGSGKTTCMRLMNGLLQPEQGTVFIEGEPLDYTQAVSMRRKMGYVRQGSGLFPHLNVYENLSLVARRSGWSKPECKDRAIELLQMVHLDAKESLTKYPLQLSGGQRQRVGIARSLFMRPKIIFMDEPFGALDPITRNEIQDLFIELQTKHKWTVVMVTHDLAEAFKMSHAISLLNMGRVEQSGPSNELIQDPATSFVKQFLSSHSPAQVLERIFVYAVMKSPIWLTIESSVKDAIKVTSSNPARTKQKETQIFHSWSEVEEFHRQQHQKQIVVTDENKKLCWMQNVASGKKFMASEIETVFEADHFFKAIKLLLHMHALAVPVINKAGEVSGLLDEGAIRGLS